MNNAAIVSGAAEAGGQGDVCLPLMKWAGGKRRLVRFILPHLQQVSGRYFEPFIGGGAVLLALRPPNAVVGDENPEVTNCYEQVKTAIDALIRRLGSLENTESDYYEIRRWEPSSGLDRAVRTLYLTRLSFNGIYRQNRNGKFNVPYGYKTHLSVADEEHLRKVHTNLKQVIVRTGDFAVTIKDARKGDTIYFDPPYTVAHGNNGFVKYNSHIFSWDDQRRLAALAKQLVKKGCTVVVSNADHPSIDDLYAGFKRLTMTRASVIAADSEFRRSVSESLFLGKT